MAPNSYMSPVDASVANVTLPTRIPCSRCSRKKTVDQFAKHRVNELKSRVRRGDARFNPEHNAMIACVTCTTSQTDEMFCQGCNVTKSKDRFSKAQRKDPDNAYCWPCMEERANEEPGNASSDSGGGSDGSDDSDFDPYGGVTGGSTMAALSLTGAPSSAGGVSLNGSSAAEIASSAAVSSPWKREKENAVSVASGGQRSFAKVRPVPTKIVMDEAQRVRDLEAGEKQKMDPLDDVEVKDEESDDE